MCLSIYDLIISEVLPQYISEEIGRLEDVFGLFGSGKSHLETQTIMRGKRPYVPKVRGKSLVPVNRICYLRLISKKGATSARNDEFTVTEASQAAPNALPKIYHAVVSVSDIVLVTMS